MAVDRHDIGAVVNGIGALDIPDDQIVAMYRRTHPCKSTRDMIVIGNCMRPDQLSVFVNGVEISRPVCVVNTHFMPKDVTFPVDIRVSSGELRVLPMFCPAICQSLPLASEHTNKTSIRANLIELM
jgi:hypothetical protein